jgi:hypothetical protein
MNSCADICRSVCEARDIYRHAARRELPGAWFPRQAGFLVREFAGPFRKDER